MKLTYWMQINIKVSYKLILTLWASKFSRRWEVLKWKDESMVMRMIKHSSILKVLKVTSLQYLYNISKKKLWSSFWRSSTSKLLPVGLSIFDESSQTFKYFTGFHSCLLLLVFRWAWPFRSWGSQICCVSWESVDEMNWFFLHVNTNLGKLMLI